jgi:hypothetical protein
MNRKSGDESEDRVTTRTLRCAAAAIAAGAALFAATGSAPAKMIANQPGRFQIDLPDEFQVVKHGRVPGEHAYMLLARSKKGNVKLFAKSLDHADPTVDLGKHLALWEKLVRQRGVYSTLRRTGKLVRKRGLIAQMYRAEGPRMRYRHPFVVYVGVSIDRRAKRVYTLSVASEAAFYAKNRVRLLRLARSFRPYYGVAHVKNLRHSKKRISLRGKLRAQKSGLVTSTRR